MHPLAARDDYWLVPEAVAGELRELGLPMEAGSEVYGPAYRGFWAVPTDIPHGLVLQTLHEASMTTVWAVPWLWAIREVLEGNLELAERWGVLLHLGGPPAVISDAIRRWQAAGSPKRITSRRLVSILTDDG